MTDVPDQNNDARDDGPTGEGPTEGRRLSATERAQMELIRRSVLEARAFPPDWDENDREVQYLYRAGSIIVRDWHLERVLSVLQDVLPGRVSDPIDIVAGATRLSWSAPDEGPSVQEVLRLLEGKVGQKVAAPDYLLYVCVHSCAAIEQEVPKAPGPYPPLPEDGSGSGTGLGEGVNVVVVDTGLVEGAATDHDWMNGVTGEPDNPYYPDPNLPDRLAQDGGHGTFTAGCVRVTAPQANVHVVNASALLALVPGESPIGGVFESDMARLVRSQLVAGPGEPERPVPDILVLNFAGTTAGGDPPLAFSALYDDLIQHLCEVLILSPAGNEGDTRKNWPAAFDWVVSVGALDTTRTARATWSNHGPTVDVYALGDRLINAYAKGTYICTWEPVAGEPRTFDGMAVWSGTSFSTPLVAGMVAARMSTTGQNSRRAWRSLRDLAEQQALSGVGPVL